MRKLIINLAPVGIMGNKEMNPYLPVTPDEIIDTALTCADKGASIIHMHARDKDGNPTYKKEIYEKIILGIRRKNPDLIITASTSGRVFNEFDKRSEVLTLEGKSKPDMGSLTLGSLNFLKDYSLSSNETIIRLALMMKEKGIKPELEIFDVGMVNFAKYLIEKDILEPPYYFNIFLGNISSAQPKLLHAGLIISELPQNSYFSFAGIGKYQKFANSLGVIAADGIRIGLEDNLWLDKEKDIPVSNEILIDRLINQCNSFQREVASAKDVRCMLDF